MQDLLGQMALKPARLAFRVRTKRRLGLLPAKTAPKTRILTHQALRFAKTALPIQALWLGLTP
jgi:hypothetical protein